MSIWYSNVVHICCTNMMQCDHYIITKTHVVDYFFSPVITITLFLFFFSFFSPFLCFPFLFSMRQHTYPYINVYKQWLTQSTADNDSQLLGSRRDNQMKWGFFQSIIRNIFPLCLFPSRHTVYKKPWELVPNPVGSTIIIKVRKIIC